MKERYEKIRHYLLSWGAFHPDEKMNCLQIIEKMSPQLRKGLPDIAMEMALLIEDQNLYIKKLKEEKSNLITQF